MSRSNTFDPARFWLLLRKEMIHGHRNTLIVATVVMAALFFILAAMAVGGDRDNLNFHHVWFPLLLLIGGFIFTSVSFSEMNSPQGRQFYLSLPASTIEKFAAKWLLTAILFPAAAIILYWLFVQLTDLTILRFNKGFTLEPWYPFTERTWFFIRLYIVLQTLFLVGAVAFRNYSFFKTILSLLLLQITLAVFTYLCLRIGFYEYFDGMAIMETRGAPNFSSGFKETVEKTLWPTVRALFWWGLMPVMLAAGYFKLKEKEV